MPCHATHMMKEIVLPPTVRRRDPIFSCSDIAQCFNTETKKMVDYAWRPVTDAKLLGFLDSVACKRRGWFPYENGHALVSHRAKALRTPAPVYQVKDYPYRVSMILRKGTW